MVASMYRVFTVEKQLFTNATVSSCVTMETVLCGRIYNKAVTYLAQGLIVS